MAIWHHYHTQSTDDSPGFRKASTVLLCILNNKRIAGNRLVTWVFTPLNLLPITAIGEQNLNLEAWSLHSEVHSDLFTTCSINRGWFDCSLQGKQKCGRPRFTQHRSILKDLTVANLSCSGAKRAAPTEVEGNCESPMSPWDNEDQIINSL